MGRLPSVSIWLKGRDRPSTYRFHAPGSAAKGRCVTHSSVVFAALRPIDLHAVFMRRKLENLMPRSCSGKPQSESVADRGESRVGATSFLGWGYIVWLWAARFARQGCRAIARAAINLACAGLLAITPPRPALSLMTARVCLKLRRPRRAYDAAARVSVIDVRQVADPDRTAEQMTKMAAAFCTRGLQVEAKDVLRKANALAPHAAAPRSALVSLLEEDLRAAGGNIALEQWAELEDLLQRSVVESPLLAAPRLALATCLRQEARYLEAQTAAEMVNAPGLRVRAENLLQGAVAAEPHLPAPR